MAQWPGANCMRDASGDGRWAAWVGAKERRYGRFVDTVDRCIRRNRRNGRHINHSAGSEQRRVIEQYAIRAAFGGIGRCLRGRWMLRAGNLMHWAIAVRDGHGRHGHAPRQHRHHHDQRHRQHCQPCHGSKWTPALQHDVSLEVSALDA